MDNSTTNLFSGPPTSTMDVGGPSNSEKHIERGMVFDLHPTEKVVRLVRRHPIALLGPIGVTVIMLIIFVIGASLASHFLAEAYVGISDLISERLGYGVFYTLGSMYLLSMTGYFYIAWLDYYLDILIITDQRIIRLEQIVLFGRKISEASFQHLQDASSQVRGVLSTVLNVGTIFVETAGERENFAFSLVKNPSSIAALLLELQREGWRKEGVQDDFIADNAGAKPDTVATPEEKPSHSVVSPAKLSPSLPVENNSALKTITSEKMSPPVPPVVQEITKKNIERRYTDGRIVIDEGMLWQSDQELTNDVEEALRNME